MDYFSLLQWPAMVINILAVWLLTYQSKRRRNAGFWCSLLSRLVDRLGMVCSGFSSYWPPDSLGCAEYPWRQKDG